MAPITGKDVARSHEQNRKIVCAFCFMKKGVRNLTDDQEQWIQKWDHSFSITEDRFPTGLCGSCRLVLKAHYNVGFIFNLRYSLSNNVK